MATKHDSECSGHRRTHHVQNRPTTEKTNACHFSPENTVSSLASKRTDTGNRKSHSRTGGATATGAASGRSKGKSSSKWNKPNMVNFSYRERQTGAGNTYRIGPDPDGIFDAKRSRREVEDALKCHLDPVGDYSRDDAAQLCRVIADEIRNRIKALGFPRYRIICDVVIGQKAGQCVQMGSRCVWDLNADRMVNVAYQNKSLFAVASVYAVYLE